jgi:Ni/Fe-hydrogenase subunit HybB-like protein
VLLVWPVALVMLASAGYSAFVFGQAEGRDFWKSPLVLPHLLLSAATAGVAILLLAAALLIGDARAVQGLSGALWLLLVVSGLVIFAETLTTQASQDAARAAHLLTRGAYSGRFWGGVVGAGIVVPILLLTGPFLPGNSILAALLALAGLWLWEDLWVRAGQALPLS